MKIIDDFLNSITMYRLMLYFLFLLIIEAFILSFFHQLSFTNPISLAISFTLFTVVCWGSNRIFASIFKAPTNEESAYISAWILTLIVSPYQDLNSLPFMLLVAVLASGSKYLLAIQKKHLFNPVAMSSFLTTLFFAQFASSNGMGITWWANNPEMMPLIVIGGLLIVKKIKKWDMVLTFFLTVLILSLIPVITNPNQISFIFQQIFLDSPILFFAFIMFTEPQTTPPSRVFRIIYAGIIGFLFTPLLHFGSFYTTPEMALICGNLFSYIVSPKEKLLLSLKQKNQLSPDTYDFLFGLNRPINYLPGQYMEWTLPQKHPDTRGYRRFFTLASSPTEDTLRIGVKFYPNGSSWKRTLMELPVNGNIVAAQLNGEFTLPKDPAKKLVFIAGGIGVTPFRSIVKYLLDKKEKRDIILIYSVKAEVDAVYMDLFNQAAKEIGLKNIVNVSNKTGSITGETIVSKIPDFKSRTFYLSGPHGMVDGFKKTLSELGVPGHQLKSDYFPGYA